MVDRARRPLTWPGRRVDRLLTGVEALGEEWSKMTGARMTGLTK